MDGSTDCANIEEKLFLAVYFDPYSSLGTVHVKNVYFCTKQPSSVDAPGLYDCLKNALTYLGDYQTSKLIDLGCDGASVNLVVRALKGLVKEERPWIAAVWCSAHRLELAIKDALKNTFFSTINERMLRLYYIYRKAPKKCRELEDLIAELSECLDTSEFPTSGGSRPIHACGTRFITHNVAALNRIIDRFGAYPSHITALTEDSSAIPADKQKLKGYVTKWRESKMSIGCAVFHDILKPTSLHLQSDQLCTISDIEAILKSTKAIET